MLDIRLDRPGRLSIAGAPEGHAARVLDALAATGPDLVHVSRDAETMVRMAESLAVLAPGRAVLTFPAWDCLPYDRLSPRADLVGERIATLAQLADPAATAGGRVVLTTVNSLLQRVPPRAAFLAARFAAKAGARLDLDALMAFLERNGYARSDTVMEPGEYAVRGGIVDLFAPGRDEPLRLDLFGDELEAIRTFDPLTQRSTGKTDAFELRPVNEVVLDKPSIDRFRERYRELFGLVTEDPLYESVSAGRRHAGMEHWLPLFHDHLETLPDYLPGAAIVLDPQTIAARDSRLETIADHYAARIEGQRAEIAGGGSPYRPLKTDTLYIDAEAWDAWAETRTVLDLSPFSPQGRAGDAGGRRMPDFSEARARPGAKLFDEVGQRLAKEVEGGKRALIAAYSNGSRERLAHLMTEHGVGPLAAVPDLPAAQALPPSTIGLLVLGLDHGFTAPDLALTTEQDILGDRLVRRPRRRRADKFLSEVSDLIEGDLVVHMDHGIGRYDGLQTIEVAGAPHDCLKVVYDGDDRLFVPVENIEVLSRYGSEDSTVALDRLGGAAWQARKARLKQRIRDIADQLIKVAAERSLKPGEVVQPPEGLYDEFCARFPFPETEDQLHAIEDVLTDLASGRPMDRLVCGDVGFGKTEVALRAAFVAAMSGMQVAVVVPTTLLARQHFRTFSERFAGLPLRLGHISRMVSVKDAAAVRAGIADGGMDIVVGTHALLAKGINFRRLGLLVIDEEQHFGVSHKERLKQMRADVHVLTLTATPIPRTLQMALAGVREMSLIATPPVDRLAVRTFVAPYDRVMIREAILRERFRGGQVFYVCPRVSDLAEVEAEVKDLLPEIRLAVAHGQLAPRDLEAVMGGFYDRQYDVLLSTNIVESGLDIPTANTLIVHRADMFGLSGLYQLRGRVGRGKLRGYAYLTLPSARRLSKAAEKRLHVMQALDTLGAGFSLASHDMDIRGAGNLLGEEQSGHIREVGIELYQRLLEEAVENARHGGAGEETQAWTPQIGIGTPVLIPEAYVADLGVRLGLYRRIGALEDRAEIDGFAAELADRFGPVPEEVQNLLQIVAIKRLCRLAGIEKIDAGPKGAVVAFRQDRFSNPPGLIRFITAQKGTARVRPDQKLVLARAWELPQDRLRGVRRLLERLVAIAGEKVPATVG